MGITLFRPNDRVDVRDSDLCLYDTGLLDGDSETVYTVRVVAPDEFRRLRQPYVRFVVNRQTHQREEQITDADAAKLADDLIDAILVEWRGVQVAGEDVPCTREYKVLLDPQRKAALIKVANTSRIEKTAAEDAESFRGPALVRRVVE